MADQGASSEQKINIATYFIMSSPTAQVKEVVTDVRKLVADPNVLSDAALGKIMREYNMDTMFVAPTPDGTSILVSPHGEAGDGKYLETSTNIVYDFDHLKQKVTGKSEAKVEVNAAVEKFRAPIEKLLLKYGEDTYKPGKYKIAVFGKDNGTISINVSASNVNLNAYWAGGWRSKYTVNVSKEGNVDLVSSVKLNVHYFEDGNVQLNTGIEKSFQVAIKDADSSSKAIVDIVKKVETDFHTKLDEIILDMHAKTFKAMRRFLPITKQQMNWNINAHNIASQVGSG